MAINGAITLSTWSTAPAVGEKIIPSYITELRTAINRLETFKPGVTNCGFTNYCQTCQSQTCQSQSCQACQTCQTTTCQSQAACQACQTCQTAGGSLVQCRRMQVDWYFRQCKFQCGGQCLSTTADAKGMCGNCWTFECSNLDRNQCKQCSGAYPRLDNQCAAGVCNCDYQC